MHCEFLNWKNEELLLHNALSLVEFVNDILYIPTLKIRLLKQLPQ